MNCPDCGRPMVCPACTGARGGAACKGWRKAHSRSTASAAGAAPRGHWADAATGAHVAYRLPNVHSRKHKETTTKDGRHLVWRPADTALDQNERA